MDVDTEVDSLGCVFAGDVAAGEEGVERGAARVREGEVS